MTVTELKKYKNDCYSALSRDLTEFEKNFLFISGGILAFSTSFIQEVLNPGRIYWLYLLFFAWALIIISIGLMMTAFLKSASASDQLLNTVEDFELQHELYDETVSLSKAQWLEIRNHIKKILRPSKRALKLLRRWAVICFIVGIVSMSAFVSRNLTTKTINESEIKR